MPRGVPGIKHELPAGDDHRSVIAAILANSAGNFLDVDAGSGGSPVDYSTALRQ
jgi:hypothetical protein